MRFSNENRRWTDFVEMRVLECIETYDRLEQKMNNDDFTKVVENFPRTALRGFALLHVGRFLHAIVARGDPFP